MASKEIKELAAIKLAYLDSEPVPVAHGKPIGEAGEGSYHHLMCDAAEAMISAPSVKPEIAAVVQAAIDDAGRSHMVSILIHGYHLRHLCRVNLEG